MGEQVRILGIDAGAETVKVLELLDEGGTLRAGRRRIEEHGKEPVARLAGILRDFDWQSVSGAAATGRLARLLRLPRVPVKQAQLRACRALYPDTPVTLVSIGSRGFSILEWRPDGAGCYKENGRCAQGTGNFLRQLAERLELSVEQADALCAGARDPIPLSGRCPVILKTELTNLANSGADRAGLVAGLFDAIADSILAELPGGCPERVALVGGVGRSRRIRERFERLLARRGMSLLPAAAEDDPFLEALGCALVCAGERVPPPSLDEVLAPAPPPRLEWLPPLVESLPRVRRLRPGRTGGAETATRPIVLGFDAGSTGSKLVAVDVSTREPVWEGYRPTAGDPLSAAQALLRWLDGGPAGALPVTGIGVTGSGREIVGAALMACYGTLSVLVLNEIVAHAEGALHFESRVDTIFEIGGQDAKYIRVEGGQVADCAMNESCSAGTGSFIEEQGRHLGQAQGAVDLSREALAAPRGVSLGQHCSVFMAEAIDEAVAAGVPRGAVVAGLYDAISRNYLHRVKGDRPIGEVVFCQGMPFTSDALAAAMARLIGRPVTVPACPGTIGALGAALVAARELPREGVALAPSRFLAARVEQRDSFICRSKEGCGGVGNRCSIARIHVRVNDESRSFRWGGSCALHEQRRRRQMLSEGAPDPFRERAELAQRALRSLGSRGRGRSVALADEFMLAELFPFWAAFLHALGLDLVVPDQADAAGVALEVESATASFCAPLKRFHAAVRSMAGTAADHLLVPMVRCTRRAGAEPLARTCPVMQSAPDLIRATLEPSAAARLVSPVIDVGPGDLRSREFISGCRGLARALGRSGAGWRGAWRAGCGAQDAFDRERQEIGRRALEFCRVHGLPAVVVLGLPYALQRRDLNANAPAILREQGAMAVPMDCLPVGTVDPFVPEMYWGHGQRLLHAARRVRDDPDLYGLVLTSHACGPDALNLHFCEHVLDGKPFAVIETDGHRGEAGTRTRVEAFLHCVRRDHGAHPTRRPGNDLGRVAPADADWAGIARGRERALIPSMGPGSAVAAAAFRGLGLLAESLPPPDRECLRLGQRHTSGKECLPMILNLGALLRRLEASPGSTERFVYLMPRSLGPCRFGLYSLLLRLVIGRLGLADRVRIWSPVETGYFDGLPPGFSALLFAGLMASDLLDAALLDVRPSEERAGTALGLHDRYRAALLGVVEQRAAADLSVRAALGQAATGEIFGIQRLLADAAREFARARRPERRPSVLVVGEIFARLDAFTNGGVVEQLEARGMLARRAGVNEWLEYIQLGAPGDPSPGPGQRLSALVQRRIQSVAWNAMAGALAWPPRRKVVDSIRAARGYVRPELCGEAVLTVGAPLHEYRAGHVDAAVSVGTWGCMHNRIAEAQLARAAEREGLLSLTLPLDGEPVAADALDDFAFEVHARTRGRRGRRQERACTS